MCPVIYLFVYVEFGCHARNPKLKVVNPLTRGVCTSYVYTHHYPLVSCLLGFNNLKISALSFSSCLISNGPESTQKNGPYHLCKRRCAVHYELHKLACFWDCYWAKIFWLSGIACPIFRTLRHDHLEHITWKSVEREDYMLDLRSDGVNIMFLKLPKPEWIRHCTNQMRNIKCMA